MSYSVIHMQKLKMSAMKGIENHNERLKESKTNPDIDHERSKLNYELHSEDSRTYYMRVKDRIRELKLQKAVRRDAVVSVGFITTSDKAFFDGLSPEEIKRFFQVSYDFLRERYGERNVISSKVHLDERTPHMHTFIVPVTEGRLSAKSLFTPVELKSLQTDYHRCMNDHGFSLEKGQNSRKHVEMAEYKKQSAYKELDEVQENIQKMRIESDTLKNDLKAFKKDLARIDDIKVTFDEINAIQGEFGLVGKKKVKINTEDFERLKDIAKRQHLLETKLERLERDNASMKSDIDKFSTKDMASYQKAIKKEKALYAMKNELETVKDYLTESNQLEEFKQFHAQQKQRQRQKGFDLEL